MPGRHELSDAEWAAVEPHLPPPSRGQAWADHRRAVNGVPFWASAGPQRRDLPGPFGPWQTASERSRRWRDDGTWGRLLGASQRSADRAGLVGRSLLRIDGTAVRASRAAAGGKSRAGGRAGRPRPRAEPGRLQQQKPPRHRRRRAAAGGAGDGRAGA